MKQTTNEIYISISLSSNLRTQTEWNFHRRTYIYIHTYVIGHNNPSDRIIDLVSHTTYVVCVKFHTYSYSQKYFAFLKYINFKEKMLREGIILKYFSYILINITRGTQK